MIISHTCYFHLEIKKAHSATQLCAEYAQLLNRNDDPDDVSLFLNPSGLY